MKNHVRKSLAFVLALCMIFTMLPVAVFAEETTETVAQATTFVYLSDWDWISATVGWDTAPRKDIGVEGKAISLIIDDEGNRSGFAKAVAAHAASRIVYDIEGKGVVGFQSFIGVNQDAGECGFEVYTDVSETPLYKLDALKGTEKVQFVDVEIPAEAKQLILVTTNGASTNSDHSIWADAKIILDGCADEVVLDQTALTIGWDDEVTLTATTYQDGAVDDAQVTWASSDESVVTVAGGTIHAVGEGTAVVTASVKNPAGETVSASCAITVGEAAYVVADNWSIVNGDNRENWSVVDEKTISILAQNGDYTYNSDEWRNNAKNVFLTGVESADFEISVKMDFKPDVNFESAGLVVFADDFLNVVYGRRYHTWFENESLCTMGVNVNKLAETHQADPIENQGTIWLKLVKSGSTLSYFWSADGKKWTEHVNEDGTAASADWAAFEGLSASDLQVGVYTGDSNSNNKSVATFSEFTIKYTDGEQTLIPFAKVNAGGQTDPHAAVPSVAEIIPGTTVKIEAEEGYKVGNGKVVKIRSNCSGGCYVGDLGGKNGVNQTLAIKVTAAEACTASMDLHYITKENRDFVISVNGGENQIITAVGNGNDWTTVSEQPVTAQIELVKGENIITIAGNNYYAADVDYVELYNIVSTEPVVKVLAPAEGWTVRNENSNLTIVDENTIKIATERGDFSTDANAGAPDNYWIRVAADQDFTLTAKVGGGMTGNYQKAGIMVFANETTIASVVRRYHSGLSGANGNVIGMFQQLNGAWGEPAVSDPSYKEDVTLKLVKSGSTFTGYYSFDEGETWTKVGTLTNNTVANADFKIGVYAVQGSTDNTAEITISNFTYNDQAVPFAEESAGSVPVEKIVLSNTAVTIDDESTVQLTASVIPSYATNTTVTWTSDNEAVVTVDENGLVTGVSVGTATITATADGVSATCVVTVNVAGQYVWLSDLNWLSAQTEWDVVRKDTGVSGNAISLLQADGTRKSYAKAIAAHADSEVVFDIEDMGVRKFISDVGVNKSGGDCGFQVYADDTMIAEVTSVAYSEAVKHIEVEVPAGTKTLTLVTNTAGDNGNSDHSIWAGPYFEMDTSVRNNLRKISAALPSYMAVNGTAQVAVSGELVKGTAADLSAATVTYASSDEEILAIAEDGTITAKADGIATVTVEVTLNGITKTASGEVIIGKGDGSLWAIPSPDGELQAIFALDDNGSAKYMVLENGVNVIESSSLGLVSSIADFTEGLEFVSVSEMTEVVDEYTLTGAKVSNVKAVGNEMTITFAKYDEEGDAYNLKIVVRMYDDGLAFRYAIDGDEGDTVHFTSEATTTVFPATSDVYGMIYIAHNEAVETKYTAESISGDFCEPMLYKTPNGTWVLLSEASLTSNYCGTYLKAAGDGSVNWHFSKEQSGQVVSELPFESPWRFAVIGTAEEINLNTMAETLSPDCEGDFSWVEPGVTAWTWLNRESTSSGETYLRYIDFAAEMGWEYLLLDEGWQPRGSSNGRSDKVYYGYYDWFPEVLEHAKEKGVKLLVWANHNDLKDDTYREQMFAEWEELGIAGLKPDFFNSSSQSYIKLYEDMIEDCAKYHLLLNLHGIPKPAGERRTYPNLLTREGIFGHEQELFKPAQMSAYHNIMLAFMRNAVGPADYTPMFSFRNSGSARNFSKAQMAAMPVVYESGIQCLADRPDQYLGTDAELFFRDMPAAWDNSFLPVAEPGEKVVMVRQNGEDYYVGGMTVEAWDYELDLSFLGEGTYYAILLTDGETVEDYNRALMTVTSDTKLDISMIETGGFAMRIMREDPAASEITLDKSELVVEALGTGTITATATKDGEAIDTAITWSSSDESVATVSGGTVTGVSGGTAVITATVKAFDGTEKSASCTVTVTPATWELDEGWSVVNADNRVNWNIVDENTVTIKPQHGDYYVSGSTYRATAKNVFMHDVEAEDFEISVALEFQPEVNFATAGLLIYAGDQANFALSRRYHTYFFNETLGTHGVNGTSFPETKEADPVANQGKIWLKIIKSGTTLTALWSADGKTWTEHATTEWSSFEGKTAADLKVGVYTGDSLKNNTKWATFSDFTIKYADTETTALPFAVKNVVDVYSVSLDKTEAEIEAGANLTLTASIMPSNADNQALTWTSSDEKVATVENGVVNGVGAGTATITVTAANGKTAQCVVTVTKSVVEVTGIELSKSEAELTVGDELTLTATVSPEDATDKTVTWTTSDASVATVEDGKVAAVAAGSVTITATAGNASASCNITVAAAVVDVADVKLDKTEAELTVGDELTLTATVSPEDATDKTVTWSTTDENVAAVEDGVVTAVGAGEATITVTTANGKTAQCVITVNAKEVPHEDVCKAKNFSDVDVDEWYHGAIDFALTEGIMSGDAEGTFRPNESLTRAELVQILYNIEGRPEYESELSFIDVNADNAAHWFYDAVIWAAESGYVLGDPDGAFRPDDLITREEMVTIMWRYLGGETPENAELTFADAGDEHDWATAAIAWAVEHEVVKGTDGNRFAPKDNTLRCEIAQVMKNVFDK